MRGVGPRLVSTNAIRNRIVVTSAIPTEPAMFQCTFSKVTQKNVARKKKSAATVRLTARGTAAVTAVTISRTSIHWKVGLPASERDELLAARRRPAPRRSGRQNSCSGYRSNPTTSAAAISPG